MIGMPDPDFIARELFEGGMFSCLHADTSGWIVTHHLETRIEVDRRLSDLWAARGIGDEIRPRRPLSARLKAILTKTLCFLAIGLGVGCQTPAERAQNGPGVLDSLLMVAGATATGYSNGMNGAIQKQDVTCNGQRTYDGKIKLSNCN